MRNQPVGLDASERRLLLNVLNEVLHGFAVENFDEVIGKDRDHVRQFLDDASHVKEDEEIILNLDQTFIFRNALRKTLASLSVGDFQVRTGEDISVAKNVLARLDQELGGLATK
jgi:hypothetical protein